MATNKYVYSGASGTDSGDNWTDAAPALAPVVEAASGDTDIWVKAGHDENTADLSWACDGGGLVRIIVVETATTNAPPLNADRVDAVPSTTHADHTTSALTITVTNGTDLYMEGLGLGTGGQTTRALTLSCGIGGGSIHAHKCRFESAYFEVYGLDQRTGGGAHVEASECLFKHEGTFLQYMFSSRGVPFIVRGGGMTADSGYSGAGTWTFVEPSAVSFAGPCQMHFIGFNFYPSGETFDHSSSNMVEDSNSGFHITFDHCNLPPNIGMYPLTQVTNPGSWIKRIASPPGGGSDWQDWEEWHYGGKWSVAKDMYRTDGMTNGTNGFSLKVETGADCSWERPIKIPVPAFTNNVASRKMRAFIIAEDALLDNEVWMDVYAAQTASEVLADLIAGGSHGMATGTSHTTDGTSTWNDILTQLTTPVQQFLESGTFTPTLKGGLPCYVAVGKASATFWLDLRLEEV